MRGRDDGDPGGEVVEEAAMLFRRPFGGIRSKRAAPAWSDAGFKVCGRGAVGGRIGEITEANSKLLALLFRRKQ